MPSMSIRAHRRLESPAHAMPAISTLYAEQLEGKVRFRLEVPGSAPVTPLQREFVQVVDPGTLRALQEGATALLRSVEHAQFPAEARQRGSVLYRTLVPPELRAQLAQLAGPLLVATSLYTIPWELFFDGEEFWGLRYAIGRRILMDRAVPPIVPGEVHERPRALIVGADPRGDLPFVREEVERICDALSRVADVTLVSGPLATFEAVTGHLGQRFDLIHFCGHVVTDPTGAPALLLADQKLVSATVIEPNLTGHPVVVLNGCASVRGASAAGVDQWEERFSSVAYGFLFGGAMAVVGTLCEVSDRRAATLADEFYRRVLAHVPVGEALRCARERLRTEHPSSPAWLSFVLYGNPAQLLAPADDARPSETSPLSTPAARRPRPWGAVVGGLALLALGAVGYQLHARRTQVVSAPVKREAPVVVGVMAVRTRGADVPQWMRELTRDALNTMLSKVSGLRVYSRQKIDFLREKRQLTEIEAAEQLGMSKMLAVTIDTSGERVELELELVDIATGLLEATEQVQGSPSQLIELQNQIAERSLHDLGVQLTAAERDIMLAGRSNESLESYRLLTETLGAPPVRPSQPEAPRDRGSSWFPWVATAYAGETSLEERARGLLDRFRETVETKGERLRESLERKSPDERAIAALLDMYRGALETKNIAMLSTLQTELPEAQRQAYAAYFSTARDLAVTFNDVDIIVVGDDALATFTRLDTFTDVRSGRPMRLEVRINSTLVKQTGAWKIKRLQQPS